MNPTQILLVQNSFNQLRPAGDFLAAQFYSHLFELMPDAKRLFKRPSAQQYAALMRGLSAAVANLDAPSRFVPYVHALARQHHSFGVTADYYRPAASALLDTLQTGLGSGFTSELRDAWAAACDYLFAEMTNAIAR